jgi:uncharacterized membrane protein YdbT with pleckstrin-like domain
MPVSRLSKLLMDGERIIAKAHLHPIVLLWPVIVTILFLRGGAIVILPLIWLAWAYWFYSSAEFAVTNRRIIAKWGVINSRHSVETNLDKVEGVTINQGILGSRLNYGSVIVRAWAEQESHFHISRTQWLFGNRYLSIQLNI